MDIPYVRLGRDSQGNLEIRECQGLTVRQPVPDLRPGEQVRGSGSVAGYAEFPAGRFQVELYYEQDVRSDSVSVCLCFRARNLGKVVPDVQVRQMEGLPQLTGADGRTRFTLPPNGQDRFQYLNGEQGWTDLVLVGLDGR